MEETIYNNFNVYIYIYIFPFFFSIEYYILAFIKKGGKNRGLMAAGSVCLLRNTLIMSLCVTSFFLSLSSLVPWNWCNNAKSSIAYLFFFPPLDDHLARWIIFEKWFGRSFAFASIKFLAELYWKIIWRRNNFQKNFLKKR